MINVFIEKIKSGEVPAGYSDPQKYIYGDSGTEASDVYSYAMYFFREMTGKNYFEYSGIPEDEFFMMADPDSEKSVIDEKNIPAEYSGFADILKKMTVFRRDARMTLSDVTEALEKINSENTVNEEKAVPEVSVPETEAEPDITSFTDSDKYSVEPDFDYGIILNNKRSGRIEFRPLLHYSGKSEGFTVPVDEKGRFVIAVSKRHRDFEHISNPSSVYGDNIIPVGLACAEAVDCDRLYISAENINGKVAVNFNEASFSGEKTDKSFEVKWG